MSDTSFTTYLTENPRMIGALFTLSILLAQAGSVAASQGTVVPGP